MRTSMLVNKGGGCWWHLHVGTLCEGLGEELLVPLVGCAQNLGSGGRCVLRTVFPWVASRSRTPEKLQYEPSVGILQHVYEYAPLINT